MIKKLLSLINIFGKKDSLVLIFIVCFSLVSGLLEIAGIGLLALFALSITDPSVFLEKIFIADIKDYLIQLSRFDLIKFLSIAIFLLFVVKHLILFLLYLVEIKIMKKITLKLKEKIYQFYLSSDFFYLLDNRKSDFINTISSQTSGFMGYIYNILNIAKEFILISIIFFTMMLVDWKIILSLTTILLALTIIFAKIFKKKLNEIGDKTRLLQEKEIKHLDETYQSIRNIKLEKKENFFQFFFYSIVKKKNHFEILHYLIGKIPKIYLEIVILLLFIGTVLFFVSKDSYNQEFFGTITFFAFAIIRILPAFISLNNAYSSLSFFRPPFEIIYEKIKNIKDFEFKPDEIDFEKKLDEISICDLKFKYNNTNKLILDKINLILNNNDKLGIIGVSGSGKSTLAHLIMGLLKPSDGQILFNHKEIKDNKNYTKNKISYLPQDSFIMDGSLIDNIAFGDANPDEKKINECIDLSNLRSFVNELPMKAKSIVGEGGSKLSHGQRQRLGLARILYSNSKLIIFDESFNALDNKNENLLLNRIDKLRDKILIFIAHKIDTLKFCNKLLILKDGKILDFGETEKILSKNNDIKKYFKTRNETN